ncbi:MAG: transporter [Rikenellaceae bacterium]|nr:transporter [Rikenellaceae bacterium]
MTGQLKSLMLPLAMVAGYFFSGFFSQLAFLTPGLIFVMLLVTFCRVTPSQMCFSALHLWLLLFQFAAAGLVFWCASYFDSTLAQGSMICIFAPTAISAVIIASMLGADVVTMATFTMLSNTAVALTAPVVFSLVGSHSHLPFSESFWLVFLKVIPVLVAPFALSFLLKRILPGLHAAIGKYQIVSFYIWAFALMIVMGQTVEIVTRIERNHLGLEAIMAGIAFIICVVQFSAGKMIGRRYGDRAAGGQSLGQKNTILAIWLAQNYLDPVACVAPACYVIWQNIVNSRQLWKSKTHGAER